MSLLSDAMENCTMLDKTTTPDGYGGFTPVWKEGAEFKAAIVFNTSLEARRAQAEGVKSLYTVTTRRGTVLEYHDVFKRARDGKVFRVTSDGDDKYTPNSATLDMRQVTAEEWSLVDGQSTGTT
jgi:head-tail adaptor